MSDRFTTGFDDLDALLGGGFLKGGTVSIQHNVPEAADLLALRLSMHVLDSRLSVTAVDRPEMTEADYDAALKRTGISLDALLDNNQLFVLDGYDEWNDRRNVFRVASADDVRHGIETALGRARSRGMAHLLYVETLIELFGQEAAWNLNEWYGGTIRGPRDLLLDFLHRPPLEDTEIKRYVERADQVIVVEGDSDEIQLTVTKAPGGRVGEPLRFERVEEPPYMRLGD